MELSKDEQIKNLEIEFVKLLILLKDKFPDAYKYYTDRLKPIYKGSTNNKWKPQLSSHVGAGGRKRK